jgi:prepilin-type N-terminal cleavage/methylation domain-containing protein
VRTKKAYKSGGFTIIEVMFVLAIAAIILITVLAAIPALQRGSRNNLRKQDVASILEDVSHYMLNNSANFPASGSEGQVINLSNLREYQSIHDINFYSVNSTNAAEPKGPVTNDDLVEVYNHELCDTTGGTSTNQGASYTDVVALYALENSNGAPGTPQCAQM